MQAENATQGRAALLFFLVGKFHLQEKSG